MRCQGPGPRCPGVLTSIPDPARVRICPQERGVAPGWWERVLQGEGASSALGFDGCPADRHKGARRTLSGGVGYPSTGVEAVSRTRTVRSSLRCV